MMKLILLIVSVGVIGTAGYFLFLKEKTLPAYLGVHESVEMNADTRSALFAYDAIRAAARADDLEALISLAVFVEQKDTQAVRQLAEEEVEGVVTSDGIEPESKLFMLFPPFGEPREVGQFMLMKVSENALWFAQSFRTETEQRSLYEYLVYRVPYTNDGGVKVFGPKSRLGYDTFAKSSSDSEDVSDTVILKKVEELAQKNP